MWDRDVPCSSCGGAESSEGRDETCGDERGMREEIFPEKRDVESHQSKRVGSRLFTSQNPLGNCFAFICIPLNFWRSFNWLIGSLTGS